MRCTAISSPSESAGKSPVTRPNFRKGGFPKSDGLLGRRRVPWPGKPVALQRAIPERFVLHPVPGHRPRTSWVIRHAQFPSLHSQPAQRAEPAAGMMPPQPEALAHMTANPATQVGHCPAPFGQLEAAPPSADVFLPRSRAGGLPGKGRELPVRAVRLYPLRLSVTVGLRVFQHARRPPRGLTAGSCSYGRTFASTCFRAECLAAPALVLATVVVTVSAHFVSDVEFTPLPGTRAEASRLSQTDEMRSVSAHQVTFRSRNLCDEGRVNFTPILTGRPPVAS